MNKNNNKAAVLSWIIKTYSPVVTDPKGQNHSGNDSGHILSNVSVILGSSKRIMTWIHVPGVTLVIVGSNLI